MTHGFSADGIKKIGSKIDDAARQAAGEVLRSEFPFEPVPTVKGDSIAAAPKHVNVGIGKTVARIGYDPKADPNDFTFSVSKDGLPVNVPELESYDKRTGDARKTGEPVLDPRDVLPAMEKLRNAAINKDGPPQFVQRLESDVTARHTRQ